MSLTKENIDDFRTIIHNYMIEKQDHVDADKLCDLALIGLEATRLAFNYDEAMEHDSTEGANRSIKHMNNIVSMYKEYEAGEKITSFQ